MYFYIATIFLFYTMIRVDKMAEQKIPSHGGNLQYAAKKYGIKKSEILDYSANINPQGLPSGLRERIISGIDDIINYPDPFCTDLKISISGIPQGGSELIDHRKWGIGGYFPAV